MYHCPQARGEQRCLRASSIFPSEDQDCTAHPTARHLESTRPASHKRSAHHTTAQRHASSGQRCLISTSGHIPRRDCVPSATVPSSGPCAVDGQNERRSASTRTALNAQSSIPRACLLSRTLLAAASTQDTLPASKPFDLPLSMLTSIYLPSRNPPESLER